NENATSNEATVSITVSPVNDDPVLIGIGDRSVEANNLLEFTLFATDPDTLDTLTYSASNLPQGALFTGNTFSWTPVDVDVGTYPNVHFEVSDGNSGVDSEDIVITVTEETFGPTQIYRSVGPGNTSALATGSGSNTLDISGDTATFGQALADNIGVGDRIDYNADGNTCYIHARTSPTSYIVSDSTGGTPLPVTGDTGWSIFRAHTSLADAVSLDRDIVSNDEIWNIACYADAQDTTQVAINDWITSQDNYI
ncbi:unnamed protein product, partial [marine sediment metagenome]